MIKAIEGIVSRKDPAFVILKTNSGVSYGIFISLFCSAKLSKGEKVELAITQSGEEVAHYDLRFLKPLDEELLHEVGKRFKHIITIEDGTRNGGMGSAVLEWLSDHGYTPTVKRMGMPDEFVEHGTVAELKRICNMDIDSIVAAIKETKK